MASNSGAKIRDGEATSRVSRNRNIRLLYAKRTVISELFEDEILISHKDIYGHCNGKEIKGDYILFLDENL